MRTLPTDKVDVSIPVRRYGPHRNLSPNGHGRACIRADIAAAIAPERTWDSEVRVPAGEDTWRPLGSCQARMMCAMPEESFVTVQSAGHLRDTRQVILALTLDFEHSPIEHDA